jgi:hypothetical protein
VTVEDAACLDVERSRRKAKAEAEAKAKENP